MIYSHKFSWFYALYFKHWSNDDICWRSITAMINNYNFEELVMHCALIEAFHLVVVTTNGDGNFNGIEMDMWIHIFSSVATYFSLCHRHVLCCYTCGQNGTFPATNPAVFSTYLKQITSVFQLSFSCTKCGISSNKFSTYFQQNTSISYVGFSRIKCDTSSNKFPSVLYIFSPNHNRIPSWFSAHKTKRFQQQIL